MSVETKLIQMMGNLRDPQPPNEVEWNRFTRRAHRSVWGRRAGVVGAIGMAAIGGTSLVGDGPFSSGPISPATQGEQKPTGEVEVWFVKDGELHRTIQESSAGVTQSEERGGSTDKLAQLEDALKRLFAGPTDDSVTTAIPPGTELVNFEVDGSDGNLSVLIEVSDELTRASDEKLATAQIVYTATQLPELDTVRMLIAGGNETAETSQRDDFDNGPPPIILAIKNEPVEKDDALRSTSVVFGSAQLDGGQLFYKVLDAAGHVIAHGKIHVEPCHGIRCRSPYTTRIPLRVNEARRGHLEVFIKNRGTETERVRISVIIKPKR
ncbi:MAG: Sporulation and spore germination [Actinomycetota bacterium]|jgi:hypothetical protein|nr:Sporulation and spore germination [Actinomycetota bacterium]